MSDIKTKRTFEKLFKEAVYNFDETKIFFEHGRSVSTGEVKIKFVLNGKLATLPMYYNTHDINLWKWHFIDYIETGNFDMNQYWQVYGTNILVEDLNKIVKIPLGTFYGNPFYPYSKALDEQGKKWRAKYKDCGYKLVIRKNITSTL